MFELLMLLCLRLTNCYNMFAVNLMKSKEVLRSNYSKISTKNDLFYCYRALARAI